MTVLRRAWSLILLSLTTISADAEISPVCSDGLSIDCHAPPGCRLTVAVGALTPDCGASVPLSAWTSKTAPSLSLSGNSCPSAGSDDKKLGLLMTDPDAPHCDSPGAKYWLHWLVLNVNRGSGIQVDLNGGEVIASFAPPTPPPAPPGSPPFHRYQFILFAYSGVKAPVTRDGVKSLMNDRNRFRDRFADLFQDYDVVAQTEIRTQSD